MVHQMIEGAFRQTNLSNESAEYLAKREELRLAEIDLMKQRERVAELRRHLPPGPAMQDYAFEEGPARSQRWRHADANHSTQRAVYRRGSAPGDLSPDVWQAADEAVPDVHRVD